MADDSWGRAPAITGSDRARTRMEALERRMAERAEASQERAGRRAAARDEQAQRREEERAARPARRRSGALSRTGEERVVRDTRHYATNMDAGHIRNLAARGASSTSLAAVFGVAVEEIERVLADA